jgi:hypothetical protein
VGHRAGGQGRSCSRGEMRNPMLTSDPRYCRMVQYCTVLYSMYGDYWNYTWTYLYCILARTAPRSKDSSVLSCLGVSRLEDTQRWHAHLIQEQDGEGRPPRMAEHTQTKRWEEDVACDRYPCKASSSSYTVMIFVSGHTHIHSLSVSLINHPTLQIQQ